MYKALIIFLVLYFGYYSLKGQDSLDIPVWINTRGQTLGLDLTLTPANDFKASWIKGIELRTETEDFLPQKEEYLFRFSPSTPAIRRAQSRLIQLAHQERTISRMEFRAEIMKYILQELLEIRNISAVWAVQQKLVTVYEDEHKLISNLLPRQTYNIKDLLQIGSQLEKLELEVKNHEYWLQLLADHQLLPATGQLISINEIANRLPQTEWNALNRSRQTKDQLDADQLEAEMTLEKAEEHRVLDFVQLRYNGPHTDPWSEKLALGVGIQLPYSGKSKWKLEELRVEQLLLGQELSQQRTLDSLKLVGTQQELRIQIEKWKALQERLSKGTRQLAILRERGVDAGTDSPEIYLFQEETLLKIQLDIVDLEDSIYKTYLDLLDQSGVLGNADGQWINDFWVGGR